MDFTLESELLRENGVNVPNAYFSPTYTGHEAREADVQADRLRQPPADDAEDGGGGLRVAQGHVLGPSRGRRRRGTQ